MADHMHRSPPAAPNRQTLLTFRLQGEVFALDVARVHEIIDPLPMTRVPRADPFVPGLINVRGSVVPVVGLRQRLGMPPGERTEDTRMVVLEIQLGEDTTKIALEADSVDQVIEIETASIEPVPEIGITWPTGFLAGVAKRDSDLIIVLRAETVFAPVTSHALRAQ
jgi:purine-binding chemotaxis protein CheW